MSGIMLELKRLLIVNSGCAGLDQFGIGGGDTHLYTSQSTQSDLNV